MAGCVATVRATADLGAQQEVAREDDTVLNLHPTCRGTELQQPQLVQ